MLPPHCESRNYNNSSQAVVKDHSSSQPELEAHNQSQKLVTKAKRGWWPEPHKYTINAVENSRPEFNIKGIRNQNSISIQTASSSRPELIKTQWRNDKKNPLYCSHL